MTDRRAHLLLFAVILFWAGNFPLSKWAILGEPVRMYHVAGAALVIGGVLLATRR